MYLMARRSRLHSLGGVEWAVNVLARAKEVTGADGQLWATVYSSGFGTVAWTSWWADLASMEAAFAALRADADFRELQAEGRNHLDGGVDDELSRLVFGQLDPARMASVRYVSAMRAVCAAGSMARGAAAGAEIARRAEVVTGVPTLYLAGVTGPYGGIGWLTGYSTLAEFEAAEAALAADQGWLDYIDSLEGCYLDDPSISQQILYGQLA